MRRTKWLALLIWLSLSVAVWAQSDKKQDGGAESASSVSSSVAQYVSETQGTPLAELIRGMLARNKDLEAAREQLHQAEARLTQARLLPNPSLEVGRTTDLIFANEGEGGYSFGFSQPIELGGKRAKRARVAQLALDMTKAQIADAERQLTAQVRARFGEALAAAARLELLERVSGLNQQMARVMNVRLRSGDASKLDSSLLLAATNQVEAQRVQAENELAGLVLQIKTLVGMTPEEPLVLRGHLQAPALSLAQETVLTAALQQRPDLQAARLREEMAEAGIELAKAEAVPNPSAFVRYSKDTLIVEEMLPPRERIAHTDSVLSFGVSIPLPLFNRQQGSIAEAGSLLAQARAQRQWVEQMVRRDVLLAYRKYEAVRRTLDVLSRGVVGESQESFRIVRLAYDLGEMRLLDVVNQQRLLIEAQTSYLTAQRDYYVALVDLERAVGKEIESLRR